MVAKRDCLVENVLKQIPPAVAEKNMFSPCFPYHFFLDFFLLSILAAGSIFEGITRVGNFALKGPHVTS